MKKQIIWVREFTKIELFQKPRKISYGIIFDEPGMRYGVSVFEEFDDKALNAQEANLTANKLLAENLLKFLYENSIGAGTLHDIIYDLKVNGIFKEKIYEFW